jgi:hypothetical protein
LDFLALEIWAVLLALVAAFFVPRTWEKFFEPIERLVGRIARRPVLSLVLVGVAPIVLRLALQPMLHTPAPFVHDEFANVLAGDTFAHGRVANPMHPLWKFFETFHVLQQPAYASMYPPGQGIFLGAGQFLTGTPYAGVLLGMGLLCATLLWMLRAWMPPGWALLGASLAVIRLGLFSYWANSYWGGAPAAIGGALVAGAIPRIFRQGRTRDAVLLGAGLVLLAMSRPYEGLWFSIPFDVAFVVWAVRGRCWRSVIPLAAVLLLGGVALAYYNWRVTGNVFEMPELVERHQLAIEGNMLWDKPHPPPQYNNLEMRHFFVDYEPGLADVPHNVAEFCAVLGRKATVALDFFLGPLLALPLILAPWVLVSRRTRLLLAGFLSMAIGIACVRWRMNPHYFAPATCVIYAFVLCALRRLWTRQFWERPVGRFAVRGICAVALIMVAVRIFATPLGVQLPKNVWSWSVTGPRILYRENLAAALSRQPDRFLVIVRYEPRHPPDQEWVYNDADIDKAKIVWARDRGPENERLLEYFHDRHTLIVEPDVNPTVARPYSLPEMFRAGFQILPDRFFERRHRSHSGTLHLAVRQRRELRPPRWGAIMAFARRLQIRLHSRQAENQARILEPGNGGTAAHVEHAIEFPLDEIGRAGGEQRCVGGRGDVVLDGANRSAGGGLAQHGFDEVAARCF